jgi:hypothetical protein
MFQLTLVSSQSKKKSLFHFVFCFGKVAPLSSEFYSLLSYGIAIILQIFMYCWFGNEVQVKVSHFAIVNSMEHFLFVDLEYQRPLRCFSIGLDWFISRDKEEINFFHYELDETCKTVRPESVLPFAGDIHESKMGFICRK